MQSDEYILTTHASFIETLKTQITSILTNRNTVVISLSFACNPSSVLRLGQIETMIVSIIHLHLPPGPPSPSCVILPQTKRSKINVALFTTVRRKP